MSLLTNLLKYIIYGQPLEREQRFDSAKGYVREEGCTLKGNCLINSNIHNANLNRTINCDGSSCFSQNIRARLGFLWCLKKAQRILR
jgi:hypothetical protein